MILYSYFFVFVTSQISKTLPVTASHSFRNIFTSQILCYDDEEEEGTKEEKREIIDELDDRRLSVRFRRPKIISWEGGIQYLQSDG